jgi:4-hydroxy-tetrahydrodipicolinate reductase
LTLRVIQWATGNIGTRALRAVIDHPELDLAGVLVFDNAKDGVDAGVLCDRPTTGVAATTNKATITALDADCALYMPRAFELDDVVALLERGINIVTTCGELQDGGRPLGPDRQARVLAACAAGSSSIYATGSSPGFITDALPFALLSLQRRVDLLEIDEYADLSQRDSPFLVFQIMGFGQPPESYDARRAQGLLAAFAPALSVLASAAGTPVDDWSCTGEVAVARRATTIAAGTLDAGTIAAQRTTIAGSRHGADVIRFRPSWYCTQAVDPAWELRPTGWRVQVHGDASLDVAIDFPVRVDELGAFTPALTANRPVNAVPYVCAAAPGILTTAELPPVVPGGPGSMSLIKET